MFIGWPIEWVWHWRKETGLAMIVVWELCGANIDWSVNVVSFEHWNTRQSTSQFECKGRMGMHGDYDKGLTNHPEDSDINLLEQQQFLTLKLYKYRVGVLTLFEKVSILTIIFISVRKSLLCLCPSPPPIHIDWCISKCGQKWWTDEGCDIKIDTCQYQFQHKEQLRFTLN